MNMMKLNGWLILLPFLFCSPYLLHSQTYSNHFGTGNDVGVSVSVSSTQGNNNGSHSLSGTALIPDSIGAARFLAQASLGSTYEDIGYVTQVGINPWLDEQFGMPASSYLQTYQSIYNEAVAAISAVHADADGERSSNYLAFTFYEKALKEQDVLRHKVAFALSQILVISIQNSNLNDRGFGTSSYYDVLYQGAYGNFRDLLMNVTLHPAMGVYLSHMGNQKADPTAGTSPDENYAREIMQLFTIGLFEMNNDGTYKTDDSGERISTYDIEDIQELARVFTGLSGSAWDPQSLPALNGYPVIFYPNTQFYDYTLPMAMYEDYHDTDAKTMIDGSVLPAGQTGMQDINDAIDVLFNHPNTGPFIATRLIQQLVKSNPSPDYINRIATVFNNNGQGVRGDIQAVIEAILTDPEARDCEWIDNAQTGKMLQPIERLTNLYKAFDITSPSGKLWFNDTPIIFPQVEQSFLAAPSVFNFFTPFYAESNYVAPNDMVSPEFQILHSTSSINYINILEFGTKTAPFPNSTAVNPNNDVLTFNNADFPSLDLTDEIALYESAGTDALIERLNLIVCRGQLNAEVRTIIADAINQYSSTLGNFYTSTNAVQDALYFMMMSPSYIILK